MCVEVFFSETFLILRITQRNALINAHWSSRKKKKNYSCQISIKLEFTRKIFRKNHEEANSHF